MIKNKPFLTSSNTTGNRAYFMSWRINTISFLAHISPFFLFFFSQVQFFTTAFPFFCLIELSLILENKDHNFYMSHDKQNLVVHIQLRYICPSLAISYNI